MTKPFMNLDEVVFDDVEENGRYTSSRGLRKMFRAENTVDYYDREEPGPDRP